MSSVGSPRLSLAAQLLCVGDLHNASERLQSLRAAAQILGRDTTLSAKATETPSWLSPETPIPPNAAARRGVGGLLRVLRSARGQKLAQGFRAWLTSTGVLAAAAAATAVLDSEQAETAMLRHELVRAQEEAARQRQHCDMLIRHAPERGVDVTAHAHVSRLQRELQNANDALAAERAVRAVERVESEATVRQRTLAVVDGLNAEHALALESQAALHAIEMEQLRAEVRF